MFKDIKVGDKIWNIMYGWATVIKLSDNDTVYPIRVKIDKSDLSCSVAQNGKFDTYHLNPTWFWDEIKFEIPKKPLPKLKVDTKVLVWDNEGKYKAHKEKRYFSHFNKDGSINCFFSGRTSWTVGKPGTTKWDNWEIYKEDEI